MGQFLSRPPPHDPPCLGKTIVVISDTHGLHRDLVVPEADILVHAGDWTRFGSKQDADDFNAWLGELPHRHKIVVEGNHESGAPWINDAAGILTNATFLRNAMTECDGVRIHGKGFFWNMTTANPYDDLIAPGTDIIVAHNPAKGYVDGGHGCSASAQTIARLRPRLYVCGHIHSAKGQVQGSGACATTLFVNGASVAEDLTARRERING